MHCTSCGHDRPLNREHKCATCAKSPDNDNTGLIIGGIIGGLEGGISGAIEGAIIGSLLDD